MARAVLSRRGRATFFILGWALQLAVAATGLIVIADDTIEALVVWCIAGSAYAVGAMVILAVLAYRGDPVPESLAIERSAWVSVM